MSIDASILQENPPEVLSSVALPIQPTLRSSNGNDRGGSSTTTQNTTTPGSSALRYKHVLLPQAINPRMDLVALISRDVNTTVSGAASGTTGVDLHAGIPPPPPGMSAARSQALMRMRLAARAKALAAAGIAVSDATTASSGSSGTLDQPKVMRSASLRLSLWRMASVAGEQGARVWDVAIGLPDRIGEADGDAKEFEDICVDALSWSPDGLVLALAVGVRRRRVDGLNDLNRFERCICLYALQDGHQLRVVPLNESIPTGCVGIGWQVIGPTDATRPVPGSAEHVLSLFSPLPDISSVRDDKEGKARQRQRMFQALRESNKPKVEEDKRCAELVLTEPRGLGKAISDHPRAMIGLNGGSQTTSSILYAWTKTHVYTLLDGTIYLGTLPADLSFSLTDAWISGRDGDVHFTGLSEQNALVSQTMKSSLLASSPSFKSLLQLRTLSSYSFNLLTYCYDTVVTMRSQYRTMHAESIAPWNRRIGLLAKRYASFLPSELAMLLCTGFANDTMLSLLLGNDTLSENDLTKMKDDVLRTFSSLALLTSRLSSALQRLILVYEELQGCARWHERFGALFGSPGSKEQESSTALIENILRQLVNALRQSRAMTLLAEKEYAAWTQYHRWWMSERTKQEALRDKKIAVSEAHRDTGIDLLLLLEFVRRGFEDVAFESSLGIKMDMKTRGFEFEDDGEDEDGGEESARDEGMMQQAMNWIESHFRDAIGSASKMSHEGHSHSGDVGEGGKDATLWCFDPALEDRVRQTIKVLAEEPKADQLFANVDRMPPSSNDFAVLGSGSADLFTGAAFGLDDRLLQSKPKTMFSLKDAIADIFLLASPLFYQSFSRWASKHGCEKVTEKASVASFSANENERIGRKPSSSLESVAGNASEPIQGIGESEYLIRTCSSASRRAQRTCSVLVGQDDVCELVVHHRPFSTLQQPTQQSLTARLRFEKDENVIDLRFFTMDEIVALLQDAHKQIRLASIRLDEVAFLPSEEATSVAPTIISASAQRSVTLTSVNGGNANWLALNHRKDVCATLDDEGHLVYWDMVMQFHQRGQDEAGDDRRQANEIDEEML